MCSGQALVACTVWCRYNTRVYI